MPEKVLPKPLTVSALTQAIKAALEPNFAKIYVEAELSNWRVSPAGHAYFDLKDAGALIPAVMFASALARCRARAELKSGAKVVVYANVTVYPPHGRYQLNVMAAKLAGAGDLMQQYLALKAKLEAEGLFAEARKRPLPALPHRIGLVTSETGAVVHDMCCVLTRRFPSLHVRLYPVLVQGGDAPRELMQGLAYFNSGAWTPDVVIIARGGGSFEDLFCFNDEALVRAVAASRVPVVSAVGHETDFTLCDFAADLRAGTPSIAAERAVPVRAELDARLADLEGRLIRALRGRGEFLAQRTDHTDARLGAALRLAAERTGARLDALASRLAPTLRLSAERAGARLDALLARLAPALRLAVERADVRLRRADERLALLSPYSVLDRGYSLTTTSSGAVIRSAETLAAGDVLVTRFAEGQVKSTVI